MKKEQIFIGLYSDDLESVFIQKDRNRYYDLRAKREVLAKQIRLDSFVPYTDVIEPPRICTRGNVLRVYDLDRCRMLSLNRVYIGHLSQVQKFSMVTSHRCHMIDIKSPYLKSQIIKRDLLLYENDCKSFRNIETGEFYPSSVMFVLHPVGVRVGDFVISQHGRVDCSLFTKVLNIDEAPNKMEKGKILEKYRAWKRNK